mmetsp:Transcript_19009/g.54774  ORF Transcript_19009/g.54774 Transcript_19009/m.54774 type:complete len:101 (+) Transcript_19009:35-337(+)
MFPRASGLRLHRLYSTTHSTHASCASIRNSSSLKASSHWRHWLTRTSGFRRGLEIPFARRGFFGPPFATQEEVETEIQRNAGQFTVTGGSAAKTDDDEKK